MVLQHWEALAAKVQNILKDYPSLSLTHGRKVCRVSIFAVKLVILKLLILVEFPCIVFI